MSVGSVEVWRGCTHISVGCSVDECWFSGGVEEMYTYMSIQEAEVDAIRGMTGVGWGEIRS